MTGKQKRLLQAGCNLQIFYSVDSECNYRLHNMYVVIASSAPQYINPFTANCLNPYIFPD